MKKFILKDKMMNESNLQRVYIHNIYPRVSKLFSDKRFINVDNGSIRGSHWTCFYNKRQ